jgi:hypothetical protein
MPIVYMGMTTPMVPLPFGAGTTCPAPPIGGLIPGMGPGCNKITIICYMETNCKESEHVQSSLWKHNPGSWLWHALT